MKVVWVKLTKSIHNTLKSAGKNADHELVDPLKKRDRSEVIHRVRPPILGNKSNEGFRESVVKLYRVMKLLEKSKSVFLKKIPKKLDESKQKPIETWKLVTFFFHKCSMDLIFLKISLKSKASAGFKEGKWTCQSETWRELPLLNIWLKTWWIWSIIALIPEFSGRENIYGDNRLALRCP